MIYLNNTVGLRHVIEDNSIYSSRMYKGFTIYPGSSKFVYVEPHLDVQDAKRLKPINFRQTLGTRVIDAAVYSSLNKSPDDALLIESLASFIAFQSDLLQDLANDLMWSE